MPTDDGPDHEGLVHELANHGGSSYEADVERLATQLARMVADREMTTAASDASIVNHARLGVRRWCRTVLDDIAPVMHVYVSSDPTLVDLAQRPVGVLRSLLDHDPEPVELPINDDAPDAVASAHSGWRQLLVAAEVALHEWSGSDPVSRPSGGEAWATVADVAAVTEAAALIDKDLVDRDVLARPAAPRDQASESAYARDCWAMAVAAEHVRSIAAAGPLPPAPRLRPSPRRLKPIRVRTLGDLSPALINLAAIVAGSEHLGPEMFGALAATHARTLRELAKALPGAGPADQRPARQQLATAISDHADQLGKIQVACRPLRSLDTGDPRPAIQMREIRAGLRDLHLRPSRGTNAARGTQGDGPPSLMAAMAAALQLAAALAVSANAHIQAGRWLQPRDSKLAWEKVSPDAPIADAVMLALEDARTFARQLTPRTQAVSPYRAPRDVLSPHLVRRDRQRPCGPGMASQLA